MWNSFSDWYIAAMGDFICFCSVPDHWQAGTLSGSPFWS